MCAAAPCSKGPNELQRISNLERHGRFINSCWCVLFIPVKWKERQQRWKSLPGTENEAGNSSLQKKDTFPITTFKTLIMSLFLLTAGVYLQLLCNQFGQLQSNSSGSRTWCRPHSLVQEELAPSGIKVEVILGLSVPDTWHGLGFSFFFIPFLQLELKHLPWLLGSFVHMSVHPDTHCCFDCHNTAETEVLSTNFMSSKFHEGTTFRLWVFRYVCTLLCLSNLTTFFTFSTLEWKETGPHTILLSNYIFQKKKLNFSQD